MDCPNTKYTLIANTQKYWIKINNTRSKKGGEKEVIRREKSRKGGSSMEEEEAQGKEW